MTITDPTTNPTNLPSVEMVARAWHALSDETLDAIPFGGEGCTCRKHAPYALRVLDLLYGPGAAEPDGLGAVVINPFNGGVWVRAAHPSLPWYDSATASLQDWSDPTREDHFTWNELRQLHGPLAVQSSGWTPPEPSAPVVESPTKTGASRDPGEPFGIGAVVVDATDQTWVRLHDGAHPWHTANPGARQVANWEDLVDPVLRSHGWYQW
ncbi:hypothetical protein [Nocardioides sp. URHA0032]|uniref:hypothetical protein n=1 Tax=Nocardioides sp. URHA0032 TaxID=1380388 RepID=UPI00048DCE87|nr:hypothetical protein [Nocardioides sp. URHA0032]